MLECFTITTHENARGEFWYELTMVRVDGDRMATTHNVLSFALARRLADQICELYGVRPEDQSGLYRGSIICVPRSYFMTTSTVYGPIHWVVRLNRGESFGPAIDREMVRRGLKSGESGEWFSTHIERIDNAKYLELSA